MNNKTLKLTTISIFAALAYLSFTFGQIKIITPVGVTSFHLGNTFAILGALVLGGKHGGIAAAIGMGIGDILDPIYITVAPKTIILKFLIGCVTGYFAHKKFNISKGSFNTKHVFISSCFGMLFNVIISPIFSFVYSIVLFGVTTEVAKAFFSISFIITLINGVLSSIIATLLYKYCRPKLDKLNLTNKML